MPAPVFVDASGRRRSRIQLMFYALGAVAMLYGVLIGASVVGGSVGPRYLLPFAEPVGKPLPAYTSTDPEQPVGRSEQRTTVPTRGVAPRIDRTPQPPATRGRATSPSPSRSSAAAQTTAPPPPTDPGPPPSTVATTAAPAPATTALTGPPSQPVTPATTDPGPSPDASASPPAARTDLAIIRDGARPEPVRPEPAPPGPAQPAVPGVEQ